MTDSVQARVFVSCGQGSSDERNSAAEIARILRDEYGYLAYVATEQASLEGVKEAIFPQLRDTEYLLFVDFPRDELSPGLHRGSLFSHQELAIAAYLETPYIGFRHQSVRREGLSSFLLSNVPTFDKHEELPELLRTELKKRRDWSPQWRKELRLSRPDPAEGDDMITAVFTQGGPANRPVRFFHLTVENLHRDRMAVGCTAYVEEIVTAHSGQPVEFRPAELKWAGTTLPSVPIAAGRRRDLDACFILEDDPATIRFASLSDSGKHMTPLDQAVCVTYVVLSENFLPARATLRVQPGSSAGTATVEQVQPS